MGYVQETQSSYIVRIDFDSVTDDTVLDILNGTTTINHFNGSTANTDVFANLGNKGNGVSLAGAVASVDSTAGNGALNSNFTTADGTANDFMQAFLTAISMNEGESSANSRTFAIAKQVGSGQSADDFTDVNFVQAMETILETSTSGLEISGGALADDPNINFTRILLETLESDSEGTVFDLNAMSQLVVSPADEYGAALESLRAISGTASLGISELTSKTTDVQVAQGKLEMVNGVIKNAINYLNQRARALTQ